MLCIASIYLTLFIFKSFQMKWHGYAKKYKAILYKICTWQALVFYNVYTTPNILEYNSNLFEIEGLQYCNSWFFPCCMSHLITYQLISPAIYNRNFFLKLYLLKYPIYFTEWCVHLRVINQWCTETSALSDAWVISKWLIMSYHKTSYRSIRIAVYRS